jgi:hypothetical protein
MPDNMFHKESYDCEQKRNDPSFLLLTPFSLVHVCQCSDDPRGCSSPLVSQRCQVEGRNGSEGRTITNSSS